MCEYVCTYNICAHTYFLPSSLRSSLPSIQKRTTHVLPPSLPSSLPFPSSRVQIKPSCQWLSLKGESSICSSRSASAFLVAKSNTLARSADFFATRLAFFLALRRAFVNAASSLTSSFDFHIRYAYKVPTMATPVAVRQLSAEAISVSGWGKKLF